MPASGWAPTSCSTSRGALRADPLEISSANPRGFLLIYVVLGMHKSGTTLVSQILHSSGIDMGEFDPGVNYDRGNKYERAESLALDLDILGTDSYRVIDLPPLEHAVLSAAQRERMVSIIDACEEEHEDWGMKDPRMCLTYPLWADELPPHRLIVVFRDPTQIWQRFKWKGKQRLVINPRRAYIYQEMWVRHNRSILEILRSSDRESVVLGYHELMTDDREFARLQAFAGRSLHDVRKPELYRSRSEPDLLLKLAGWWLGRRTGLRSDETFAELEEYRSRQVAATATP